MPDIKRQCRITGREFLITEAEQDQLAKVGRIMPVVNQALLLPTVHPFESLRHIFSMGTQMFLCRAKSAFSGKPQLSRYSSTSGYRTCTVDEFWGEAVDNTEFGREYDFSRPFFEQWNELMHRAYLPPLNVTNAEGSDYVNSCRNVKNCYLCFAALECQDCLYCLNIFRSNDCLYCVGADHSQYCYSCIDIDYCYECQHLQDSSNCRNCFGSLDLTACNDCIGCVGLRHAEHCIFNEQFTAADYRAYRAKIDLGDRRQQAALLEKSNQFIRLQNHQVNRITKSENCSGSYISNSKNLFHCYHAQNSQDCGYVVICDNSRDCWRGYAANCELNYLCGGAGSAHNCYSSSMWDAENCLYSYLLFNGCAHCFGCVGLLRKSYCILNKTYSRKDYFELLVRIIKHLQSTKEWGEFFPPQFACHTYENSMAYDLLEPIPLAEARRRNYRVKKLPEQDQRTADLQPDDLPVNIKDVSIDKFLGQTIACRETGQVFNYQKKELEFYRRYTIPLPDVHWRWTIRKMLGWRELVPAA